MKLNIFKTKPNASAGSADVLVGTANKWCLYSAKPITQTSEIEGKNFASHTRADGDVGAPSGSGSARLPPRVVRAVGEFCASLARRKPRAPIAAAALLLAFLPFQRALAESEGADLDFGGPGNGEGKFELLRDITFAPNDDLYVLEGREYNIDTRGGKGEARVQRFDNNGKFLAQFSINDDANRSKDNPQRLAVDSKGRVWVTRPDADLVRAYSAEGKVVFNIKIENAMGITIWGSGTSEKIAVTGSNKNRWRGCEGIVMLDPNTGRIASKIRLSKALDVVDDLTADKAGNFYVLAANSQIYKFSPQGALLKAIGAGSRTRAEDGSEIVHSVAVDSKGFIYGWTTGNPGFIVKYDPEAGTVWRREGQYKWADAWTPASAYAPLAFDSKDRLWTASTHESDGRGRHHASPSIIRTHKGFLDDGGWGVHKGSTLLLGFRPGLSTDLPYDISYGNAPVKFDFTVGAATRQLNDLAVEWTVVDMWRNVVAKGEFAMALKNEVEGRQALSFTPPRLGWYAIMAQVRNKKTGEKIAGIARHVGVAKEYPGMPALKKDESPGGWTDVPRQVFSGMPAMRFDVGESDQSHNELEQHIALANKYNAPFMVQVMSTEHCNPSNVRRLVERFKGRVKYWEFVNEPNLTMGSETFANMLIQLYPIVKEIDPAAQVMGPAACGIDLGWHERFLAAGGNKAVDIISIHDYENEETIDPVHWRWKIGALRELMAKYDCGKMDIWQTERAIGAIRGDHFLGPAQAVRVTLHRDLLETLDITPEHNNHYYLNEAGYQTVPTYLWSHSGPHPGALALRVRHALTAGASRKYAGALDFGPQGNNLFLGLRYDGDDGSTITLRSLGISEPEPMELAIKGADTQIQIADIFGNITPAFVRNGRIKVQVTQTPVYVMIPKGRELAVPRYDFGRNIAELAKFTYTGEVDSDMSILSNGHYETTHAGNPWRGYWRGKLKTNDDGSAAPETLEIKFKKKVKINTVLIHGARPDNPFCALLDYDLQYKDGSAWKTIAEVRANIPPSDLVYSVQSNADTWILDPNQHLNRFAPITTDALRLIARRTTYGFFPDAVGRPIKDLMPQVLMLREVEIFGTAD